MPIYSYRCEEHDVFDVTQRMSDGPLTACPECGREVKKIFSAPSVTGFTATPRVRQSNNQSELWNSAQRV